jgi:hypothetical protein
MTKARTIQSEGITVPPPRTLADLLLQLERLPYACVAAILDAVSVRRGPAVVTALHGVSVQRLAGAMISHAAADGCPIHGPALTASKPELQVGRRTRKR